MRCATMLAGLVLALAAPAATAAPPPPDDAKPIVQADVEPHIAKLRDLLRRAGKENIGKAQIRQLYEQNAAQPGPQRERAMHAYMLGLVLEQLLGREDEATGQYRRAVELFPRFAPAQMALAAVAAAKDAYREADDRIRKALEIDPGYVGAWVIRGQIAMQRGELEDAERYFKCAIDEKLGSGEDGSLGEAVQAFVGLTLVHVRRARESFDPEERQASVRRAVQTMDSLLFLEPDNVRAVLMKADVCLQLGEIETAVQALEGGVGKPDLEGEERAALLRKLRAIYEVTGDLAAMKRTLERLRPLVSGDERERLDRKMADIEEKGRASLIIWQVERELGVLENDGLPVEERRRSLERLLGYYSNDQILANQFLAQKGVEVFQKSFKILIDAPPELLVVMFRFFRERFPDPALARILVHFLYPYGNERTTPQVRVEAVRTLAACSREAALPALFYALRDDSGVVLREVDRLLSELCQRRSPFGGGIGPIADGARQDLRQYWSKYARSKEGGDLLADSFDKLSKVVRFDPSHARSLATAPFVLHSIELVLLDNDMAWPAWKEAYEFLVGYWGKDFRPPERREKAVEEFEREHVVKELEAFWAKARQPDEAKAPPAPAPGKRDS